MESIKRWFYRFIGVETEGAGSAGLFYLFITAGGATVTAFVLAGILKYYHVDSADVGTFGDFIGGTLNPILTFLTFMGLLITIVLQQAELRETRREMKRSAKALESQSSAADRQNFESTFFQMLTLHNTIVNSIDLYRRDVVDADLELEDEPREMRGRDCFDKFLDDFKMEYLIAPDNGGEQARLQYAYDEFWKDRQQDLAHYYRYLYNVLRFVFEYEGTIDKQRYVKLLRAQLSDYELGLLFYTALNKHGINYWLYIHEYQLLDNMPDSVLIAPEHKQLFSPQSLGEPKRAPPVKWPPSELAAEYEVLKPK